jgi:hypothetical protein
VFDLSVEFDIITKDVLKNIYLLTELDDFNSMNKQGFTLLVAWTVVKAV